jgi:ArsR family transcriptional regulator
MLNPELIPRVVDRLRALADETRLRLLLRLKDSPANVTTLTGELGIAQASVSKHLAILKQAGLVEVQRVGTQSVYRVRDQSIFELCSIVCDGVTRFIREQHAVLTAQSDDYELPQRGA